MAFQFIIEVQPYQHTIAGLDTTSWKNFTGSLSRGALVNLGGAVVKLGKTEKTVKQILETKYGDVVEIDLAFLESLAQNGKLFLSAFGAMITLVNGVNGVFNSRETVAIHIPTNHAADLMAKFGKVGFRMLDSGVLTVGPKPICHRGKSIWDKNLLDDIMGYLRSNYKTKVKFEECKFDVLIKGNTMFVEFTYQGKFCATFRGRYLEYHPAVVLAIAAGGFDDQVQAYKSGKKNIFKEGLAEVHKKRTSSAPSSSGKMEQW